MFWGCKRSYYGRTCNITCNRHCAAMLCNLATGDCARCKPGYYGKTCTNRCSKHCLSKICKMNGTCEHACAPGYRNLLLGVCETETSKGPAMKLNSHRVHDLLQVEDSIRLLTKMAGMSGDRSGEQFSKFCGTCSSPLPPTPSTHTTPRYWENSARLRWPNESTWTLLEIGLVEGSGNLDVDFCVSSLPRSCCVSVRNCEEHEGHLCIQVYREGNQVGDCVTLSPFPTAGAEFNLTVGVAVDVGRGRVGLIDVERETLLHKFDEKFSDSVFPMFHVYPSNFDCEVEMRLVSGREISVTEIKLKLIQEALFD